MIEPIPLYLLPNQEIKGPTLDDYRPKLVDVIVDSNGFVNKRPGLSSFSTLSGASGGIKDMHFWEHKVVVMAKTGNSGNDLFSISTGGTATARADTGGRANFGCTFAELGTDLYICNGVGETYEIDTNYSLTEITDADFPSAQSSITLLDRYLIAVETGTSTFYWSDVNDPMSWSGDNAVAEVDSDLLRAAIAKKQYIYLFGDRSIEIWYDDGVSPFVRVPQGIIHTGIQGKNERGVVFSPRLDTFYFITDPGILLQLNGIEITEPSPSLNQRLLDFSYEYNYTGLSYFELDKKPFLALKNTNETELIIYDITTGFYYEWYKWGGSSYGQFDGLSFCSPVWQAATKIGTLVGAYTGNIVYNMHGELEDDNGTTIRSMIRTPSVDHGEPGLKKRCNAVYFRIQRTADVTSNPTSISLALRYRDNGSPTWSSSKTVTLTATAADGTEFLGKVNRLGTYETRQWEIVIDDSIPCCITSVKENFEYKY